MKPFRYISNPVLEIAVFASILAVVLSFFFHAARSGCSLDLTSDVLITLGFSLFLLNAPVIFAGCLRSCAARVCWYTSQPFFILVTCAALIVCARIIPDAFLPLVRVAFALLGVACAAWVVAHHIRESYAVRSCIRPVIFALCFTVFAVWVSASVWTSYKHVSPLGTFHIAYFSPLFFENICLGEVHLDTLFHCSLTSMIQSYGIPSTGLDGLPFLRYHFGSHWLFAQFATLLGIDIVNFYQLCYPVIFLPLYVFCMLLFMLEVRSVMWPGGDNPRSHLFTFSTFFVFLAAFIPFLPMAFAKRVGLGAWLISPSYILSLTLVFILLCLCLRWGIDVKRGHALTVSDRLFVFAFFPLLIVCTGFLKISSMALTCVAVAYAMLRLGFFKRKSLCAALFLVAVLAVITVYCTTPQYGKPLSFDFLHFVRNFVAAGYRLYYLVFHHVWIIVLVLLTVIAQRLYIVRNLKNAFHAKQTLACEVAIAVGCFGILPGALLDIPGGSATYFSGFQQWLTVPLVLALLHGVAIKKRFFTVVCFVLCIPLLCVIAANVGMAYSEYRAGLERQSAKIAAADRRQFEIIDTLRRLGAMPAHEKRRTLLFIPQDNKEYWGLGDTIGCFAVPFVAPAISGMAMIDGLPPAECVKPGNVVFEQNGYGCYDLRKHEQSAQERQDAVVCARAMDKGFQRIIRLDRDEAGVVARTLECR